MDDIGFGVNAPVVDTMMLANFILMGFVRCNVHSLFVAVMSDNCTWPIVNFINQLIVRRTLTGMDFSNTCNISLMQRRLIVGQAHQK